MMDIFLRNPIEKSAFKCAQRRSKDMCHVCSSYCDNCSFFVKNHLPPETDEETVKLLALKAEGKAWAAIVENQIHAGFGIGVFALLIFAWALWYYDPFWTRYIMSQSSSPPPDTRVSIVDTGAEQHANIDQTLSMVAEELWKGRDVNGDRQLNCIDATILFYYFFPDKSKVVIMVNINPRQNLNHLFVSVFTDGEWKPVEPQAHFSGNDSYWMEDIWGSRYDVRYDKEETKYWRRFLPWKIEGMDISNSPPPLTEAHRAEVRSTER